MSVLLHPGPRVLDRKRVRAGRNPVLTRRPRELPRHRASPTRLFLRRWRQLCREHLHGVHCRSTVRTSQPVRRRPGRLRRGRRHVRLDRATRCRRRLRRRSDVPGRNLHDVSGWRGVRSVRPVQRRSHLMPGRHRAVRCGGRRRCWHSLRRRRLLRRHHLPALHGRSALRVAQHLPARRHDVYRKCAGVRRGRLRRCGRALRWRGVLRSGQLRHLHARPTVRTRQLL
jgi:hypothetical protein